MAHRQAALMAISERIGLTRYRFYLQNASQGLLQLFYAPEGWRDAKFSLKRNPTYHGMFRAVTFNQLTFRKDSRDFIRDVYESQGINALITFKVYRLDDTTGDYVIYFDGKLDLSTYKIEETGVTCQIIDTQLAEKVKNREGVKVNLREHTSIEGYEIPAFSNENPELFLPAYEVRAYATWGNRADMSTVLDNHYVPLWEGLTNFTETQSQNCDTPIADNAGMFINSVADRNLHMTGNLTGIINFSTILPHVTFTIKLYVNGVATATIGTVTGASVNQLVFSFTISEDFSVATGQDFWLQGTVDHSGTTLYTNVQVDISELQESVSSGSPIAYPYYEAFLRCLQHITDSNDCLQSTKFGRTDSEVVTYDSDGALGHLTKGLFMRSSSGFNNTMSISFKDLFNALSSVFCIGMGIEDVSGTSKVVIEDLDYFYSSMVVLDISAKIRENAIGKEVLPDKHYASIQTGYKSFEYLTSGGLAEFNTKSDFTTVLSVVDNDFNNICGYRADTQGIMLLRRSAGTDEDVKGDEDIFIIDSLRRTFPHSGFQARTSEDFILVTGGADADNCLNLDYTPKRNLLRNGALVRAGLQKNLGTYLRWQSGDKNTTLATQKTGETAPLVENADILVNDLEAPFFLPEQYTVECELRYTDLTAILENPKGLVKLATGKYGWILELTIGAKENKAEMKLLRANLNVITPLEGS